MTDEEQPVRLVVLGDATGAPVCDGDMCHLPGSTVDPDEAVQTDGDDQPTVERAVWLAGLP